MHNTSLMASFITIINIDMDIQLPLQIVMKQQISPQFSKPSVLQWLYSSHCMLRIH